MSAIPLPPDPYAVLRVTKDATFQEIRAAYRKLVLEVHPDKVQDPVLKALRQAEFEKGQKAYEILSDDVRRTEYDELVKLVALRREVGFEPAPRGNPFDYEVWTAEPRTSPYARKYPEPYVSDSDDDDVPGRSSRTTMKRREEKKTREERIRLTSHTGAGFGETSREAASIEEGIKARNAKAYQNLRERAVSTMDLPVESPTAAGPDASGKKSKVTLMTVPPEQLGMTIMNPERTNTTVDIIAVHGLGAIPEITWKEKNSGTNWLADSDMLPKAVPEARIMRFGYDSLWLGKEAIRTRLSTIANKLLLVLNREREDAQERPIIFIGHCFGGLVIQRALIIAKLLEASFPGILTSSVGVIFLGTPHRGTKSFLPQSALLASIAAQSDLHGGIEPGVLDAMRSDTGATLDVAEDFADLCQDLQLKITCFFEERKSNLGKVIGRTDIQEFMVPEESATFDGHRRYGLPLDHFSLNKFPSPDNGNFKDVCGEITRLYNIAQETLLAGKPKPSRSKPLSKSLHRSRQSLSLKRSFMEQEEKDLIKTAAEELSQEDFEKKYQERKALETKEKEKQNKEAEEKYKDRLVANMEKYGVPNPEEVVNLDPLPNDSELNPQEIKDKMRWYKNRVKVALLNRRVPDGQIDEILNDTGDTMVIDGVQMTYTKMALKWISIRTLKRYDVPYKIDEDDPSTVIIKRWVPDYEQEFLWDHTYQLRNGERGRDRETTRPSLKSRATKPSSSYTYNDFRDQASPLPRAAVPRSHSYESFRGGHEPESGGRGRGQRQASRQASYESVNSAPNSEDIARRRRHSRTLSIERPYERPRRQASYESVGPLRESREESGWVSDGETKGDSGGGFGGIMGIFRRNKRKKTPRIRSAKGD